MTTADRFLVRQAVFVVLLDKDGKVLMHRRKNTGYMDGRYDFASGHVEPNETLVSAAARELLEETGVRVEQNDLELFHIGQFSVDKEYTNFFFRTRVWKGEPRICEIDKCDDMQFFATDNLPLMAPATAIAASHIHDQAIRFSYIDAAVFKQLSS